LGDPDGRDLVGHFTQPFSFAGVPALSVPIGQSSNGLPIGLTIVGPAFGDELTLRIGAALETRGVVRVRTPPVAAASGTARRRHE
jgi:aspartyl-tRNA(Asn)/glutamyl-tRNA(Gln) amidotransferase subunit A